MRVRLQQWEGCTLVQVKGSRVSLLCIVHVRKPCMQYLKHKCEYKCVVSKRTCLLQYLSWLFVNIFFLKSSFVYICYTFLFKSEIICYSNFPLYLSAILWKHRHVAELPFNWGNPCYFSGWRHKLLMLWFGVCILCTLICTLLCTVTLALGIGKKITKQNCN